MYNVYFIKTLVYKYDCYKNDKSINNLIKYIKNIFLEKNILYNII